MTEVVSNASYATGCAASLPAGLDTAGNCEAVMLLLGDMPGVDAEVIDAVRPEWERDRPLPADVDTWDDYEAVCATLRFSPPA